MIKCNVCSLGCVLLGNIVWCIEVHADGTRTLPTKKKGKRFMMMSFRVPQMGWSRGMRQVSCMVCSYIHVCVLEGVLLGIIVKCCASR